jgi:hypothetical protein
MPAKDANGDPVAGTTLKDLLSTYNKELAINAQVVAQAEADAPKSGYETRQFYTLAVDPNTGKPVLETADETTLDASQLSYKTNDNNARPVRTGYSGYLIGDGFPQNGYDFGFGIQFPDQPGKDDFFLRTDFFPSRLFRFDANSWVKVEDSVRMNMTNDDARGTQKTGFINNNNYTYNDQVATDITQLSAGATVINTRIAWATGSPALYAVIKLGVTQLEFAVADHPSMFSYYTNSRGDYLLKINLPKVPDGTGTQQTIPYTDTWTIILYNLRESQKQSLSKALKPKADL